VPARFAAAKQAGASEDEIMETLYYAMRSRARAAWSTIKHIDGVEALNKRYEEQFKQAGNT
jgi:alkylhydroperoxidase/carboxymuconolactone decarboxylase family protein YurZ